MAWVIAYFIVGLVPAAWVIAQDALKGGGIEEYDPAALLVIVLLWPLLVVSVVAGVVRDYSLRRRH